MIADGKQIYSKWMDSDKPKASAQLLMRSLDLRMDEAVLLFPPNGSFYSRNIAKKSDA